VSYSVHTRKLSLSQDLLMEQIPLALTHLLENSLCQKNMKSVVMPLDCSMRVY